MAVLRRRFVLISHYPIFGGPHTQALRLHEPMREAGWDQVVILPDEPGNAVERLVDAQIPVRTLPLHRLRRPREVRQLAALAVSIPAEVGAIERILREERADVVVVTGLANPHGAIAGRRAGSAVVWQLLDSAAPAWFRRVAMPIVHRYADAEMFAGDGLIDLYEGRQNRPDFVSFWPPVDTARFVPSSERRSATRHRLGIPLDAKVVGTLANWTPQKGLEYFAGAVAQIVRARPDVWVLIAGARNDTHARYQARIDRELALAVPADRLVRCGSISQPELFFPALDLMLLTSVPRSEGVPATVAEAQSCGVAVIAANVGAAREALVPGETGEVVPPCDAAAVAGAALQYLAGAGRLENAGRAARNFALTKFSLNACANRHVQAFTVAMEQRDARRKRGTARVAY